MVESSLKIKPSSIFSKAQEEHKEIPTEHEDAQEASPMSEILSSHNEIREAMGGDVDDREVEHAASIAAAIMARRKFAQGGDVEIEENNEEQPNGFYKANEDALDRDEDSEFENDEIPKDGLDADELEDEDEHSGSLASKIMKKRKSSPMTR